MSNQNSIFKLYDIRGNYPDEVNEKVAFKIGQAFVEVFRPKKVVVGHDVRLYSETLKNSLAEGIISYGVDVIDLGMCSSPQLYYCQGKFDFPDGIVITASHAKKEQVGFKLQHNFLPIYPEDLSKIKEVFQSPSVQKSALKGKWRRKDINSEYVEDLRKKITSKIYPFRIVFDAGNGVNGPLVHPVFDDLGLEVVGMYLEPDGDFPHHGVNPKLSENRKDLEKKVKTEKADLGVIWDGDGDRAYFIDRNGKVISPHFVAALIGEYLIPRFKGNKMTADIRASRIIRDLVEKVGGEVLTVKTWHTTIKYAMARDPEIVFGSEVAGHYAFRDFYKSDDGLLATLYFLQAISAKKESLDEVLKNLRNKYFIIEEINFPTVSDVDKLFKKIAQYYPEGKISWLEGITVDYPNFRFNLRESLTEPLLRLNLDADSKELLEKKTEEVSGLINKLIKEGKPKEKKKSPSITLKKENLLGVALKATKKSGDVLLKHFGKKNLYATKGQKSLITEADLEAGSAITNFLREKFPEHNFLTEEVGSDQVKNLDKNSPETWIIDPLDGTKNFACQIPFFSTALALFRRGEIILGVVYNPFTKEVFYAEKGRGAYFNDSKIKVLLKDNLKECYLIYGHSTDDINTKKAAFFYNKLWSRCRYIGVYHSTQLALCFVACGRIDAHINNGSHPWDYAAGSLIVREAGGRVTNFKGKEFNIFDPDIVATNGTKIHGEILKILKTKNQK